MLNVVMQYMWCDIMPICHSTVQVYNSRAWHSGRHYNTIALHAVVCIIHTPVPVQNKQTNTCSTHSYTHAQTMNYAIASGLGFS